MAATTSRMIISGASGGQKKRLSLYNAASAAVGTYLPVEFSQTATVNSPLDWKCPANCEIYDFIAGPATGQFEIIANGAPVQFDLDNAAQQASSNGRCIPVGFKFVAGVNYRFRVTGEFPA